MKVLILLIISVVTFQNQNNKNLKMGKDSKKTEIFYNDKSKSIVETKDGFTKVINLTKDGNRTEVLEGKKKHKYYVRFISKEMTSKGLEIIGVSKTKSSYIKV